MKSNYLARACKTFHDINKMEDNLELRYVFTYPGIISCAEIIPSPRANGRNNNVFISKYIRKQTINNDHSLMKHNLMLLIRVI
jgi:hypothetical protein